jgi:hypothetical protein
MIVYVSTERFSTPAKRLRMSVPDGLRARLRHLSYEELFFERGGPIAHYIFTDFDRLTRFEMDVLAVFVARLREVAPEARILNDPARALDRTALLSELFRRGINQFPVIRLDTGDRPERYPVFIRAEDGYGGPETDVIHDADGFATALQGLRRRGLSLRGRIAVGYAAEAGPDGLFRKFGAYNIGGDIIAYHALRSRHWVVKRNFPLFDGSASADDAITRTQEALDEEMAFVRDNPHKDLLREVFQIAGIDFGRVDYGIVAGRPQIYEINTNPNAPRNSRKSRVAARHMITIPQMADAFERIDVPIMSKGRIRYPALRPQAHDVRLPRRRLIVSLGRRVLDAVTRRSVTPPSDR